jgi:hypothetical protein
VADLDFIYNTGAAWADLLGTVRHPYGGRPVERLRDAGRLAEWLDHVGLRPTEAITEPDRETAIATREALRAVVCARLGLPRAPGAPSDDDAAAVLDRLRAVDDPQLAVVDGVIAELPPASVHAAMARIVTTALTDLAHHQSDLGHCSDPECAKVFVDPAHTRKACCDTCSTRLRVRAYREKAKRP